MPNRREIREAVIQFLYCADIEDGADPAVLKDTFWDFVTESDRRSLLMASFRTVHHLSQGRAIRMEEFEKRREQAISVLAAWPEAEALSSLLKRISTLESKWSAALDRMSRLPKDGDDAAVVGRFEKPLQELYQTDHALAEARLTFLQQLEDFPKLQGRLEAVAASIRRLQRISDRIRMVEEPEKFPEQADLSSLRNSSTKIRELRESANQLVDQVIAHKQTIDSQLADIVENYSPQRIDPVDRAVLRLAAYEIAQQDVPVKVVLNEAIELAKRYGTSDSQRFVNGILDKYARIHGHIE